VSSVTVGGVTAPITGTGWSDTQIQVTVPALAASSCTIQQRGVATPTGCGELVITAGNGKKSVDTVTITVGGKTPTYVNGENAASNAIQTAIDNATPGDLIIVGGPLPTNNTYNEMLLMWKPVRLQGVGAASVTVNANTHPSGKMDTWRREVACLFGLSLNGGFISGTNPFDPNHSFTCSPTMQRKVDAIPLEPVVGWDPTLNGNIAELLQEPTLLGAYEGAGITVLAKGVRDINGQPDPNCTANGTCTVLTASTSDCNNYPSNFLCNPSRIDGITFKNSSQGGGGIFLHGWNHFTEVSNNRVYANAGTLTGGITIGQAENPDPTIVGTIAQAFGFNTNVNVHNNSVTQNAAYGDELNSTTPMGAGGVTFCTGADSYKFNNNWVCGNLSSGDGGGFAHYGLIFNGTISNNSFLFNQSTNPTIPTNGGGVLIMGAPPDGPVCESNVIDVDCPPTLSDGIGRNLVIDSNLIMGNTAESGSGGGLRLQNINGTEVGLNPGNPGNWYQVMVTNNIIANNVAGWDGGGVSMQDALRVKFINNTVVANDSTASAGVLFNTLGAANANNPPPGCNPQPDPSLPQDPSCNNPVITSAPLPAGLVAMQNTPNLIASLAGITVTCPTDNFAPGTSQTNGTCRQFSYPLLRNDLFWQNRPFHITVGGAAAAPQNQQNLVTLLPTLNQASTGQCVSGANYWDIGVRGDTGPNARPATNPKLNPTFSILTDAGDYTGANNLGSAPGFSPGLVSEYCNGSRVPPESLTNPVGYGVPPGISDATLPNPVFNLTPGATVDEGNNWINMTYGPLSLANPAGTTTLGNYSIAAGSSAINVASASNAPNHDFFGNPRPQGGAFDIGAVELVGATGTVSFSPSPAAFGTVGRGTHSDLGIVATVATASVSFNSANITGSGTFTILSDGCSGTTVAAGSTCTITVRYAPTSTATNNGTLHVLDNAVGNPHTVALSGTGANGTLSVSPSPVAFNTVHAGATPAPRQTVTVTNNGPGVVTFTGTPAGTTPPSSTVSGTNYSKGTDTCSGSALQPSGSCTIVVILTPTASNATTGSTTRNGTLTIRNNGSAGDVAVPLSATVVQAVVGISAPSPALTTSPATRAVKNGTITVTNSGGSALTVTATPTVTKSAGPGTFSIQPGGTCISGASVAASGGTCTINVRYVPPAAPNTLTTATAHVTLTDTGAAATTQNGPNFQGN
jgi:hypothetical protein